MSGPADREHESRTPVVRDAGVSLPPSADDASAEPSVVLPDELDGPLDDLAIVAAVDALPAEARGDGPALDVLDALELGRAARTLSTYQHRLHQFVGWCASRGLRSFPAHPETLRVYFAALAHSRCWSTVHVARAAITAAHAALGYDDPSSPQLHATLQHLRFADVPLDTTSITPTTLLEILARCSSDPLAIRDRALILAVHSGRLLPCVASALNREHLVRRRSSYLAKPPSSRASGVSAPDVVELWCHPNAALCPVRALDAWLAQRAACVRAPEASAMRGALFVMLRGGRGYPLVGGSRLGPRAVSRILQRRAVRAGLDPSKVTAFTFRAHAPSPRPRA